MGSLENSQKKRNIRQPELDVLRGVAIVLAMGWHFNQQDVGSLVNILLWPGAKFGWAGVDLFFVLSGFLVGGLLLKEFDRDGKINFRRFFIRRAFRLWPVLYLFLFAMLTSGVSPARDFFWQIALHIQNYAGTNSATHLWSLAVEEHFYILLAGLFAILSGITGRWRVFRTVLILIIVFSPLVRLIGWMLSEDPQAIQVQTHYRLDAMALGVLLAYAYQHHRNTYDSLQNQRLILMLMLVLGVIFISVFDKYSMFGSILGYSASAIASASALLLLHRSGAHLWCPRMGQALIFLGLVSYPLYLWHVPVGRISEPFLSKFGMTGGSVVAIQYALSIFVAWIASRSLERPFIQLRDRMFPSLSDAPRQRSSPRSRVDMS